MILCQLFDLDGINDLKNNVENIMLLLCGKKHNGDRKHIPTSSSSANKQTGTTGQPLSHWDLAGPAKRTKAYKGRSMRTFKLTVS